MGGEVGVVGRATLPKGLPARWGTDADSMPCSTWRPHPASSGISWKRELVRQGAQRLNKEYMFTEFRGGKAVLGQLHAG